MRRKITAIIVCVAMLLTCFPAMSFAASSVKYLAWDEGKNTLCEKSYDGKITEISEDNKLELLGGDNDNEYWYYVRGEVTYQNVINIRGNVHLILGNNSTLNATRGIQMKSNSSVFSIYAQSTKKDEMGKLIANGDESKAGIHCDSKCTLNIYGGNITATSRESKEANGGAGIGGNSGGSSGVINIYNGIVMATGGDGKYNGAGIGGGYYNDNGAINIYGGEVDATSSNGAGIGSGQSAGCGPINIYNGSITAYSEWGAGIGSGKARSYYDQDHWEIVTNKNEPINIYGGNINASSFLAAGIGAGKDQNDQSGIINIYGGSVVANNQVKDDSLIGTRNCYGICGNVSVFGGNVQATGYFSGIKGKNAVLHNGVVVAIGNSINGIDANISTSVSDMPGNAIIFASGKSEAIFANNDRSDWTGIVFEKTNDGNFVGDIYGTTITPTEDFIIPDNVTLTIDNNETLIIDDGIIMTISADEDQNGKPAIVTNNGTIKVNEGGKIITEGELKNNGEITNNGTIQDPSAIIPVENVSLSETKLTLNVGNKQTLNATVKPENATNKTINWVSNNPEIATVENGTVTAIAAGTATITVSTEDGEKTASCEVTVTDPKNQTYEPVITTPSNGTVKVDPTAPKAGDTVTITPTPNQGYEVDEVIVTDKEGQEVKVTKNENGSWTFIQPEGEVTIEVTFTESKDEPSQPGGSENNPSTPSNPDDNDNPSEKPNEPDEPTYQPDITEPTHGDVTVNPSAPQAGDEVTITPKPDQGYEVDEVIVTDENGNKIEVTENEDGSWSFEQPEGEVTIEVTFTEGTDNPTNPTNPTELPFTDVHSSDWFYDPVVYVYDKGLMTGTSATEFAPNLTTTRGMIVSILHRLEGSPSVNDASFSDVSSDDWYGQAVAWAANVGVVNGFEDGTFRPNDPITREQMAAILYNYNQYKGYDVSKRTDLSKYSDVNTVSAWAEEVVNWANAEGLVNGMTATTLDPKASATRAQVATILMRYTTMLEK